MKRMLCVLIVLPMLLTTVSAQIQVAPISENFDGTGIGSNASCNTNAALGLWSLPVGWTEDPTSTGATPTSSAFRPWSGSTPSGGTGPSSDHTTGTGSYMYCEGSAACGNPNVTFYLVSPMVDTTALTNASMSVWYSMLGGNIGTFSIEETDGAGGWTTLFSVSGNQGSAWIKTSVFLTQALTQVRFVYVSGTSFESDMAIDDVAFEEFPGYEWETNSAAASFDVDGIQNGGPNGPQATTIQTTGGTVTANMSSNLGATGWEIAVQSAAAVPLSNGGFGLTTSGQTFNLDLSSPITYINGGVGPAFLPFPGSFSASFTVTGAVGDFIAGQAAFINPANLDGIELTQSAEVEIVPCLGIVILGDDDNVQMPLATPYTFYGTAYSEVFIGSNGQINFGAGDNGWASGSAQLNADLRATVAILAEDLNHSGGGSVCFSESMGSFTVAYDNIQSFPTAGSNSFTVTCAPSTILFDYTGGFTDVDGTVGLSAGFSANTVLFLDLSAGPHTSGPGSTPYEDFVGGNDLSGSILTWTLDATGTPTGVF